MSDRRIFMKNVFASAALGLAPQSVFLAASNAQAAQSDVSFSDLVLVNGLGSLGAFLGNERRGPSGRPGDTVFDRPLMDNILNSGLSAVGVTVDYGVDFVQAIESLNQWNAIVADNPQFYKVSTAADVLQAKAQGRVGIIYCFQNAAMMEGNVENIDRVRDGGVKCVQLTYNHQNDLGGGALASDDLPLTDFGRQVIDRLNQNRMMVDLSHSGARTCLDAVRYSDRPVSINHTGCRVLAETPRNKTDEELRLVAEKGGYVGIYFMNFLTVTRRYTGDDVVAHIEHAMRVCGEDHVGIGTDTGVTGAPDDAKALAAYRAFLATRVAEGVAAPGENPNFLRHAEDLNGPHQYRVIAEKLARRGHPSRVVEKIMGGNYLRHAREIWGA